MFYILNKTRKVETAYVYLILKMSADNATLILVHLQKWKYKSPRLFSNDNRGYFDFVIAN